VGKLKSISRFFSLCSVAVLANFVSLAAYGAANSPSKFVFCYEDSELYPSFAGNSAVVPDVSPGVLIDLVKMIGERVNLEIQFVRFPWKRCLSLLEIDRVNGVIASYSDARLALGRFPMRDGKLDESRRISTAGYHLYQLSGDAPLWDGKKFTKTNITVGAPLGYSIVDMLRSKDLQVIEAGNSLGLLYMLQRGRVDAVAAPGLATDTILRRSPRRYADIKRLPEPLQIKPYYLVLSRQFLKATPQKAEDIWDATKILREQAGDLILQKY
jgi:polar amino acid transport system substrate-binding protein